MGPIRIAAISLSVVVLLGAGQRAWWQKQYADAPALACAIYSQTLRFELAKKNNDKRELHNLRRELAQLLSNKRPIFKDGDGMVIAVRDAAADVVDELNDPAYRVKATSYPVKLIACCPLAENDCARIHIPAYTDKEFRALRRLLLSERR